jgi:hypothetical protein
MQTTPHGDSYTRGAALATGITARKLLQQAQTENESKTLGAKETKGKETNEAPGIKQRNAATMGQCAHTRAPATHPRRTRNTRPLEAGNAHSGDGNSNPSNLYTQGKNNNREPLHASSASALRGVAPRKHPAPRPMRNREGWGQLAAGSVRLQ